MVSRREKLSRSFFRTREQTFHKQVALLTSANLSQVEIAAVIEANHGPSIYDRLYSHPLAQDNSENFENILARIEGVSSPELKNRQDLNGLIKSSDSSNPYKRMYFNGAARRRSLFGSTSESETDIGKQKFTLERLGLHSADSSTDDEKKPEVRFRNKKTLDRRRKAQDSKLLDSSSSDERWKSPRGRSLRQMERDMGDKSLSEDSDDLLPLPKSDNSSRVNAIYSDSDSETSLKDDKSSSSQHILKTKGELKAFTGVPKIDKENKGREKGDKSPRTDKSKNSPDGKYLKKSRRDLSNDDEENRDDKENIKSSKKGFDPSDLIVPQRQAAKKASENLKCFQGKRDENFVLTDDLNKIDKSKDNDRFDKVKNKMKSKSKSIREDRAKGSDIFDFDHSDKDEGSDILAYVPQRQAAKKAAETIKCGLKPSEEAKFLEKKKEEPKKGTEKLRRTALGSKSPRSSKLSSSSSSSSTSTSSSSSSSSSSESDEEPRKSIFDPEPKKKTDDSPFLDKGQSKQSDDGKKFKKAPDKKLKTSDGRPEIEFQPPAFEGEESSRKRCLGDRVGSSSTRSGNFVSNSIGSSSTDSDRRKRKSITEFEERCETRGKSSSLTPKKTSKEVDLDLRHAKSTPRKPNKLDKLFESLREKKEDESLKKKDEQPLKRGPGRPRKDVLKKPEDGKMDESKPLSEVKNDKIRDHRDKFIPIGGDEKLDDKSKVKPMPKSVKKALRLLDENSSPEEVKKDSESARKVEEKPIENSEIITGSDVSNKNYDKDKFRRCSTISISDKTDLDNEAKLGNNLKNNDHSNIINDITSSDVNVDGKSELTLPNLVDDKDEKHSPTLDDSARSNFTLELGLSEGAEPKKISSRTSSLGVSIYQQRSIFSPQTSNRDQLSDIVDFEHDMLAVDETVHQDPRPLPLFNFNNEFLFKEDSKEDSKRETYNLVEKLRMDYAKKSTNHQEVSSPVTVLDETPSSEIKQEKVAEVKAQESVQSVASDAVADTRVPVPPAENPTDGFNQSPAYGKGPPPTPGYHLEPQSAVPPYVGDSGKFTPSSQDGVLPIGKGVDSPGYSSQKPGQTQELPHQRFSDGQGVVNQNLCESPGRYPSARPGFDSVDPYENFYDSCANMQHDPNSVSTYFSHAIFPWCIRENSNTTN